MRQGATEITSLCERSFVEARRRSKTLPRFFTEKSCVTLVFATRIRAAQRWQRIAITPLEQPSSSNSIGSEG